MELTFRVGESGERLLAKLLKNGGRLRARDTKAARQIIEVGLAQVAEVGGKRIKVLSLIKFADRELTEEEASKLPI